MRWCADSLPTVLQLYFWLWMLMLIASGGSYIFAHIYPVNKLPLFLVGVVFGSQASSHG